MNCRGATPVHARQRSFTVTSTGRRVSCVQEKPENSDGDDDDDDDDDDNDGDGDDDDDDDDASCRWLPPLRTVLPSAAVLVVVAG